MSDELLQQLREQLAAFREALPGVSDEDGLYDLQVRFLGKKGSITKLRSGMGKLAPQGRKAFGQAFNEHKQAIESEIEAQRETLKDRARQADLARVEDLTMLPQRRPLGAMHIVTRTRRELARVFRSMGYDVVDGPHVEHEKYNFDDLNIGPDHPARDMADTFFVNGRAGDQGPLVLRTHTSPVQVRTMLNRKPPVRVIAMGTVFRRDEDATHTPMFHQIEGLCVDKGVSMADLKATLYRFVSAFFGQSLQVRFRPSFFPFVEPGAEFDMQCPFCGPRDKTCRVCKGARFIELGGSGMVHPAVLRACDIDPEAYTGWAFGFGIDRMAMLLHAVTDLRLLFEGDVRFLEQFPC